MATAAGLSTFSGAWLTTAQQDAVIGYPDAPEWPGPVSEDHAGGPADLPGRAGPLTGQTAPEGFPGEVITPNRAGGQVTDTVAALGHSAPMTDFASQTEPFAPPGPIKDTHGMDTGGTYRTEHVPMPRSPGWWRRTVAMQTWNRQSQVTDTAGWQQNVPNDRRDLIQDQGQDAGGYDPKWLPYSERPLRAKFAAEAYPILDPAGGWTPQGALPDMAAMGGQGNYGYTAPPDPVVNVAPPPAAVPYAQSALGMEYVSG